MTLTLVQAVINSVINLITIPLSVIKIVALFDQRISAATYWLIYLVKFLLTLVLVFLGSLVIKAFSRRREFKADALAAQLYDRDAMIGALQALEHDTVKSPKKLAPYTALKINDPRTWLDVFSTHPSIDRRIGAIRALQVQAHVSI